MDPRTLVGPGIAAPAWGPLPRSPGYDAAVSEPFRFVFRVRYGIKGQGLRLIGGGELVH